ncbi:MAG: 16S rRNA (cytosine(967)-C(5))-methyltransferase RsmB [Anaerovoracaceae bacterium]
MDINRKTAYEVLLDMEMNQSYSNLALNQYIEKNKPENPAFVRELVYGVTENRILLDYYLAEQIPSGLRKVKKQDLTLLRMGIYQLLFMDSVPSYAAVSETVAMARRLCRGREGFINGVLRSFQRRLEGENLPALPDRETDPVEYLSVRYSAARWLVELWMDAYGTEKAEKLLEASNGRPLLSIRVNRKKTDRDALMRQLRLDGFQVEAGSLSDRVILVTGKGTGILQHRLYKEGWFSVQDQASVLAADTLQPAEGNLVVDVCAAPGGKNMALAEDMGADAGTSAGVIYAFDIYEHKLKLMTEQAERLGISIIKTRCQDARHACEELKGKADCVLADVPCSGLGVIRRKPEIKLKETAELDFAELEERQKEILHASSSYVKPGGSLVYSTCTINPAENERQIEAFLAGHKDFAEKKRIQLLPGRETDGFFICRLERAQKE